MNKFRTLKIGAVIKKYVSPTLSEEELEELRKKDSGELEFENIEDHRYFVKALFDAVKGPTVNKCKVCSKEEVGGTFRGETLCSHCYSWSRSIINNYLISIGSKHVY